MNISFSVLKFVFVGGEGGVGLGLLLLGKEVLWNTESTDCNDSWH